MHYEAIVEVLSYASSHERAVRLELTDGAEVIGVPSSVDLHVTAHEVYLLPSGNNDETEIGISLAAITFAELL